jgi:hypothetical protein
MEIREEEEEEEEEEIVSALLYSYIELKQYRRIALCKKRTPLPRCFMSVPVSAFGN